jgi:hypothetical protein
MNIKWILIVGFLLGIAIYLMGTEKPFTFYRLDRKIDIQNLNTTFDDLYAGKQDKAHIIVTSIPSEETLNNGDFVIYSSSPTFRIYTKIDNIVRYVALN